MSENGKNGYEVGKGKPPKDTQFGAKNGNQRNQKGRPKTRSTFEDELKGVFEAKQSVTMNGQTVKMSARQIILQQISNAAQKGDPAMIRIAMPLLKAMDDAPAFEPLPEDLEVLKAFEKRFNDDGSEKS